MNLFDIFKDSVYVGGVLVSVYKYWISKNQERNQREYQTYDVVDTKYIEFQKMCMANPKLDIGPTPNPVAVPLTPEEKKQEMLAFSILLCLFERTFIMYYDERSDLKKKQWIGWDKYISDYCKRENFLEAWNAYGYSYDSDFQQKMKQIISRASSSRR